MYTTKLTSLPSKTYDIKGSKTIIVREIYNPYSQTTVLVILLGENHAVPGNFYEILQQITRDFNVPISLLLEHPFSKMIPRNYPYWSLSNLSTLRSFHPILTQKALMSQKQIQEQLIDSDLDLINSMAFLSPKLLKYSSRVIQFFQGKVRPYGIDSRLLYFPELLNLYKYFKHNKFFYNNLLKRIHLFMVNSIFNYRAFETDPLDYKQKVYDEFLQLSLFYQEGVQLDYVSNKDFNYRLKYLKKYVDDPEYRGDEHGDYLILIEDLSQLHEDTKAMLVDDILLHYHPLNEYNNILIDVEQLIRFIKLVRETNSRQTNQIIMSLNGDYHTKFMDYILSLHQSNALPTLYLKKGEVLTDKNRFLMSNLSTVLLQYSIESIPGIQFDLPMISSKGPKTHSMLAYQKMYTSKKSFTEQPVFDEPEEVKIKTFSSIDIISIILTFILFNFLFECFKKYKRKTSKGYKMPGKVRFHR